MGSYFLWIRKITSDYDILDAKISAINKNMSKRSFFETVVKHMYDAMMNMIGGEERAVRITTFDFGAMGNGN